MTCHGRKVPRIKNNKRSVFDSCFLRPYFRNAVAIKAETAVVRAIKRTVKCLRECGIISVNAEAVIDNELIEFRGGVINVV